MAICKPSRVSDASTKMYHHTYSLWKFTEIVRPDVEITQMRALRKAIGNMKKLIVG